MRDRLEGSEMMQGDFGDEEIAPATKGTGFGSPAVHRVLANTSHS
jgi:hypothetical protein